MTDINITSYEATCTAAATDQGLDPLAATLRAAGLDVDVMQTGGFCMVLNVQGRDACAWITNAHKTYDDGLAENTALVTFHEPDAEADEDYSDDDEHIIALADLARFVGDRLGIWTAR